jgi:hypothetical protein
MSARRRCAFAGMGGGWLKLDATGASEDSASRARTAPRAQWRATLTPQIQDADWLVRHQQGQSAIVRSSPYAPLATAHLRVDLGDVEDVDTHVVATPYGCACHPLPGCRSTAEDVRHRRCRFEV